MLPIPTLFVILEEFYSLISVIVHALLNHHNRFIMD